MVTLHKPLFYGHFENACFCCGGAVLLPEITSGVQTSPALWNLEELYNCTTKMLGAKNASGIVCASTVRETTGHGPLEIFSRGGGSGCRANWHI